MKNLLLIQPKPLLQRLYSKAVWNMNRSEKDIYLTFDDGPIPFLTEWVLDELKKYKATATFFCVGSNIKKNASIFERIKNEGHQVANHTMVHTKGFKTSTDKYMKEVDECRDLVNNSLFRPPYGQLKRPQYKALLRSGYKVILWDVISYDYEKIAPAQCAANVIKNTRNGSIVLFHDNVKAEENLRYALPKFLEHFTEKGFVFKALS
jgi:peptidoglycan/xylan/chitin deacetylase (PgdA/CDA1 family)